mgnify:CR=1 FL=1
MNIYLFWILFLSLWAIVPLMIIKGRSDESTKVKTSPEVCLQVYRYNLDSNPEYFDIDWKDFNEIVKKI